MAAHYVICYYCQEKFNRDEEPFVQVGGRRYAHKECEEKYGQKKTQEEKDLEDLENYIKKLFGESYINARIRKQIKEFRQEYNYSYSGILKTLIYWYDIKGNSIEEANKAIGIVPFIYQQSRDYYYALHLAKLANAGKRIEEYKPRVRSVKIQPPRKEVNKKIKLFNLGDE